MMPLAFAVAVATLSVVAIAPGASLAAPPSGFAGPARDRVVGPAAPNASANLFSRNWDGYITYVSSKGTDFNAVTATWTQPSVTCEKRNAWTVFWVGLDGWWDDTVEQGGTSAQCSNGTPHYQTWWEMFPTNAIQTVFTISPGDQMAATVTYRSATGVFVINVKDITSGRSLTRNEKCASNLTCDRSSADVVAEDVGMFGGSGFFPLANYKTMSFGGAQITDVKGHSGSFTNAAWLRGSVTEAAGGVTYATVSPLSGGGRIFRATWEHA